MIAKNLKTITLLVSLLFLLTNMTAVPSFAADPVPTGEELDENNADITILQWVDPEGRQPMTYEEFRQGLPPQEPLAIEQIYTTPLVRLAKSAPSASLVLVIVNSSIQSSIQDSLDQYVLDLQNEGYSVAVYATSGGTPSALRTYLQGQLSNGLVGCLLVGNLPVPWYEMDDDHEDTYAQFPIDLFYMDLDGTWTDSDTDGLFDGHSDGGGDRYPEIWVGRLTAHTLTGDEATLLQNYFQKNHSYRTGGIILNNRALVYVDDDWIPWADTWDADVGLAYDTRTLVKDGATTIASDYKDRLDNNYEWIQLCAHSSATSHSFKIGSNWTGGSVSYTDIQSIDPVALFYNLFACSNSRYVENNYMGGWYIFANTYGLAAVGSTKTGSMLEFDEFYDPIGQYKSLGESFKEWFIAVGPYDLYDRQWFYGMTLLGDPTLTTDPVPPTMEAIAEAEGQYYNTAPMFSNFGFDDSEALDDGWYQMDSYTGSWNSLFTDVSGTSWDNDSWTVLGFGALSEDSHTIYFKASDDVSNVEGESGEWSWQFYKDTVAPADPTSVNSTSHSLSTWSSDNTVDIGWIDATDATSLLDGYSVLWDTTTSTIPNQTLDIEGGVQSANSTALSDGNSHYFHIRSVDNAGNWQSTVHVGPFFIDANPPSDPTSVNSTSHAVSTWSSDNTVDISWTDATDSASGLDGYSVLWDTTASTIPNQTLDIEEEVQSANSTALSDGNSHYFHIRSVDNIGNWQSTVHVGPFYIETVPPTDPTSVNSTSHSLSTWSSDNTVDIGWIDATDATSLLDGYSILWDTTASTIPNQTLDIEEEVQSANSTALSDGNSHYFHIRSVDNAGNWQSTVHVGPFFIDANPPADPTSFSSTSHTVSTWSNDNTVDITWIDATDSGSGLDGYSVLWDTNASTIPDQNKNIGEGVQSASSTDLADDNSHYFHIRSVDNFGNWQSTVHYGPFYIAVNCPILSEGTVNPTSGYTSASFTYSVNYTDFENDAPDSIKISIDSGASVNMTARDSQDVDFTDGKIYEYTTTGANLGVGTHTFQFFASDGTDNAIGDIGSHSGPTVSSPPAPPPAGGGGGGGGGGATEDARITGLGDAIAESGKLLDDIVAPSLDNKLRLDIPTGTFAKNRNNVFLNSIRVTTLAEPPEVSENMGMIGLAYELGPAGAYFDPPLDLTVKYDVSLIPEGVAEKNLVVAWWDETASNWVDMESTVDMKNDTIKAKVAHFTVFTILVHTRPASFDVADLSIIPKEADLGERISVSALITNTGDLTGRYKVSLELDDVVVQTKDVTLDGGDSETISFSVTPDTAGEHTVYINGLLGTCEVKAPKAPAAFAISALTVSPTEVNIEEDITISVLVINTGDLTGTYEVTLKVDNTAIDVKDVTLAGGVSQTVTFTTTKDTAGTYTVDVDRLTGSFVVKEKAPLVVREERPPTPAAVPVPTPIPTPTPTPVSIWWIISGIISVVVATGLVSYFVVRKRREAWVLIRARVKSILTVMQRR